MLTIHVQSLTPSELQEKGIPLRPEAIGGWSVWECAPSTFEWTYEDRETAYLYAGRVRVKTNQRDIELNSGDYVVFPAGLTCTWTVLEPVRKVYRFG